MITSYTNTQPLSFDELLSREIEIYNSEKIPLDTSPCICNMQDIANRPVEFFQDKEYNLPQSIFILGSYHNTTLVGRKIRSILHIQGKINAINCSMITADMLLGTLHAFGQNNRNVWVEYHPFTKGEKLFVFDEIKHESNMEIVYPFLFRFFDTGIEEITPETGWTITPYKAKYLADGESHLRCYSKC